MPWIQPLLAHCGRAKIAAILADTIFNYISFNDNIWILKEISLKYPIDNMAALFQITTWHRTGDKPLSEAMSVCYTDIHASVGRNELDKPSLKLGVQMSNYISGKQYGMVIYPCPNIL